MNTLLVTYDTRQDGERGETAVVLPISDENLRDLIYGSSDVEHCLIEPALIAVEMLRGNVYVPGSIKDVRERRKDNERAKMDKASKPGDPYTGR